MGILSSLFQSGAPVQQVAGPMIATQKLPEELAPFYKDILGKSQALYNERTAEGFKPYVGPTMADFTPEQQQAFTGIAGLQGSQAPVFQEAMDLTRSAATPMTSEQMTTYMSPYQQAVTDIEKREATKQYESQVQPALAAQAAATGGFGGSRQAILEGMAADTQQRLLGDIQAKGSQSAYQDAVSRFNADRQAQGQAGAQLATMVPNQFKAQLGELGALQTVGEQQQRQSQTALDEAFRQYQLERNYPYDTMSKYQSVVTGAPMGTTSFAQPAPPAPSTAQTLLGGLGTLVGTYGAFGGKLPNLFPSKEGGGIADTMVYRQQEGPVGYPADMIYVHPDYGYRPPGVLGDIRTLREATQQRDATPKDIFKVNYDKLNLRDRAYLQQNIFRDGVDKNEALVDYMTNKIPGQRPYEGEPFEGNRNSIIESTMSGDNMLTPENKNMRQTPEQYLQKPVKEEVVSARLNTSVPPMDDYAGIENARVPVNKNIVPQIDPDVKKATGLQSLNPQPVNIESPEIPNIIQGPTKRDKFNLDQMPIQAAENSLTKLMAERTEGRKKQLTESTEAQTRANWLNVAQLFSRMGTATPKQGGIMGVIGAGLEAADQTLPQIAATNAKFRDERKEIQNAIEDDKIGVAQAKLNKLEKRAAKEKAFQREELEDLRFKENKKTEELRFNKSYDQKERELNATISKAGALDINDEKNIDALIKTRYYGGSINADGNLIFAEGESLDKFGNDIAGALSQITGNIMETEGISFNSAQPFISNIKNKIDGVNQDTLKKMMAEYPTLNKEEQEKAIQSLADESKIDVTIARLLLQR